MDEAWKVAAAIVAAFGGSSLILLALSGWLGKVFAARILEGDRAKYAKELQGLVQQGSRDLARLSAELDVAKQTGLRIHSDKLIAYRIAIDVVVDLLMALEKYQAKVLTPAEGAAALDRFHRERLRMWGYLAMLAPQAVMDCYDQLIDFLGEIVAGKRAYEWAEMRRRAIAMLNEIRKDVALDRTPIEYHGAY